jgi:hypothetical protein
MEAMTRAWRVVPRRTWARAHNWYLGPVRIFCNADAGVGLELNGWRLWGSGQCGEQTWNRATNDRWCHLPFGHLSDHEYSIGGITLAPGESVSFTVPL